MEEDYNDDDDQLTNSEINLFLNKILERLEDDEYQYLYGFKIRINPIDKIDRTKLLEKYQSLKTGKLEIEKKNDLLDKSLVKYFKRKNIYRAFSAEKDEEINDLRLKYRSALDDMDKIIALEKTSRESSATKIRVFEEENSDLELKNNETFFVLSKQIRDIGPKLQSLKTGSYLSEDDVIGIVTRIENLRNILSGTRIEFITTLDKHTEIDQKAKALEDLGHGLRMIDFEQLRAERQTLSDKIEERNNELAKLRLRCFSDTQTLSHLREKDFMLLTNIDVEKEEIKTLRKDVAEYRNDLNEAKFELGRLRKQHSEMSKSCGLLEKAILLRNYDSTMNEMRKKTERIDQLKKDIEQIDEDHKNVLIETDAKAFFKTDSMIFDEKLQRELEYMNREFMPRIRHGVPMVRSFFRDKLFKNA